MSDPAGGRNGHAITWGHVWSVVPFAVVGLIAWGTVTADLRALAQRVDKGEVRDDKTAETLDAMKSTLIELRADGKATKVEIERMGRQFDRIENALRNAAPAPVFPPKGTP